MNEIGVDINVASNMEQRNEIAIAPKRNKNKAVIIV